MPMLMLERASCTSVLKSANVPAAFGWTAAASQGGDIVCHMQDSCATERSKHHS